MTHNLAKDQQGLFDLLPRDWEEDWRGMPEYGHENLESTYSIKVHFADLAGLRDFSALVGQTITEHTRSIWYPPAEIGRMADRRYRSIAPAQPKYPVYVISKGRWESRLTVKSLERIGVPYKVVVEPTEYSCYAAVIDPDNILTLPFHDLGQGSIPARNWVWDHAAASGARRHWILDDNIRWFYRYQDNLKCPVADGTIFAAAEEYTDRYLNVALSGFQYFMFVSRRVGKIPPIYLNTRIYSMILIKNDIPYRWRGRYNEDTDLSLRVLKDGWCTILFNAFLGDKMTTMKMKGGNTDELYRDDGRLKMAQSLQEQHPDVVSITWKWGRHQHQVDYRPFKDNALVRDPDVAIPDTPMFDFRLEVDDPDAEPEPSPTPPPATPTPIRFVPKLPVAHGVMASDDVSESLITSEPISSLGAESQSYDVAPPQKVSIAPRNAQLVRAEPALPSSSWTPPELPQLRGRKISLLGFDTETTGLNPRVDRMVGLSISVDDDGPTIYVPFGHEGGDNLDEDRVREWATSELSTLDCEMVGSYILFDLEVSAKWGLRFPNVRAFHDILVAEPLLDENRFKYNLDDIALRYLGEGKSETLLRAAAKAHGWVTDSDVKRNLHKLEARFVGPYGADDASLARRAFAKQREALDAQELGAIYAIEREQIPILLDMRERGVKIDVPRAEVLLEKLKRERDSWLERLKRVAGPKAEFRAVASLAPALRDRGLDVPKTAPTERFPDGQDSVTEAWLVKHKGKDTIVDAILAGRRVDTLATYIEKSVMGNLDGGRIYPTYNQLRRNKESGGRTGTLARYSCSDPNLQQVAKREKPADEMLDFDEELSSAVRCLFIPDGGDEMQRDDYSQEEFRLTVNVAVGRGAEDARERYRAEPGLSFHKMAGEMAGIDPGDKKQYDRIKALNLAKSYGAQAFRLAEVLDVGLDEAKRFVRTYEERLPFTVDTFNLAMRTGEERGYIRTILGRRLRFAAWEPRGNRGRRPPLPRDRALAEYGPDIVRYGVHRSLNWYCQGSAADILKKALRDIREAGLMRALGAPLLLVHDELVHSVPRTIEGDEAAREVSRLMSETVKLSIPLLVESSRGPNWGECA